MSKNKKSTPKAKVLTAVLLVVFLGSCAVLAFAICTDILGIAPKKPGTTEPVATTAVTATENVTENTESTEPSSAASVPQSSTAVSSELTPGSTYNVDYWVEYMNDYGTNGLGVLFGARTRGVTVAFSEDNTFSVNVQNNGSVEVSAGTYSILDDSNIELRFDNSNITTATVLETEGNVITIMDFPMDVEGTTLRLSLAD